MSNLNLEFTGQPVQVESWIVLKLFTKYQFSFSRKQKFLQAYQLFLSLLCLKLAAWKSCLYHIYMARHKKQDFFKALLVTCTCNACAWRQTSCHPGAGRRFCDHKCSTKPFWQSTNFHCHLSLYHPVVTRMEIKIKNINGCELLPLLFILLSKVRSQVRFFPTAWPHCAFQGAESSPTVSWFPKQPKTLWSKKATGSCATS